MKRVKSRLKTLQQSRRGFTMPEILVTVLLFSFIAVAIYSVSLFSSNYWLANKTRVELQQNLRLGMDWMINDLRQAGDSSIVDVPADDAWYNSITFNRSADVTGGTIVWEADSIQLVRGGSSGAELHHIQDGVTRILAHNISTLEFRRQTTSSDILEINMVAQKTADSGVPITHQLSFALQLRNN